jgi:futalosine hydrolase
VNEGDPGPTGPLLLIAATDLELAPLHEHLERAVALDPTWAPARRGRLAGLDVVLQALGVGKVHTAAGLATAIAAWRPRGVLQVGIGGAYLGSFLSLGMAMWADVDLELDLGVATAAGWADLDALRVPLLPARAGEGERGREVATDAALTRRCAVATGLPRGRFATLDAITADVDRGAALQARFDVAIESMEGAAAAAVARRLGVPFAEVRAVSNVVGERDRSRWDLRGAVRQAGDAAWLALRALAADAETA